MRVGDIVRWTLDGHTEHGVILKLTATHVTFRHPKAEFCVPLKDGEFSVVPDDKDFRDRVCESTKETVMATAKKTKAGAKKVPAKTVAKKNVGKTGDGPSKMDVACDIVRKNPNITRAQAIAKFIDDAKLTKAGAATYWALVNRKLKKEKSAKA